jgi:hypothetical protein
MGRPEGAEQADSYSKQIADFCDESGLGSMIDWDRFDDPERDHDDGILPRGAGPSSGRSSFNCFPGVRTDTLHPVYHMLMPIACSPRSRPSEALTRRTHYYAAALHSLGQWVMNHRRQKTATSLELHVLSECFPLLPPMSAGGMGAVSHAWPWDDDEFYFFLRHFRHRFGAAALGGGAIDAHAVLGSIVRRLPRLTIRVRLAIAPGQVFDLPPYTGSTWPKGW